MIRFESNKVDEFLFINISRVKCSTWARGIYMFTDRHEDGDAESLRIRWKWVNSWAFLLKIGMLFYNSHAIRTSWLLLTITHKKVSWMTKHQIHNANAEQWDKENKLKMTKYACVLVTIKHSFVWFVWFVWIYLKKLSIKYLTILTLNHWAQRNPREKTVRKGKRMERRRFGRMVLIVIVCISILSCPFPWCSCS